jgi:type 1 glutamine amidotransferase
VIAPLAAAAVLALSGAPQPRALVVTETAGFRHPSIRVFYSALGHPASAWRDATHLRLVEDGLRWAVGA